MSLPTTSVPATGTTSTTTTTGTTATNSNSSTLPITQNQFLEMLMAELQNQNPMNPNSSDPMQFVTELAQFTQVEQETNTAESTSTIASGQNTATAIALLGHTVTYTDPTTQSPATGTVQSVEFNSTGPTLTINGTSGIDASAVSEVQ
ncbi:MAG TPA: flagellar hook capping FlgD N-terminal domain-containing protein [Solirubrobacteraceae bacterium]|nr:flagellar hook capping FlgD N-terminal domain-containing protein [Solirubrobacteraceae bacterium]